MPGGGATLGPTGWTCTEITANNGGGIGLKPPGVLAESSAPLPVTGSTSEVIVLTVPIPAKAFVAPGTRLRVTGSATLTNSANTKTFRARLAGFQVIGLTALFTSTAGARFLFEIVATGSAAQKTLNGVTSFGNSASAAEVATTVDMTQQQNLTLSVQLQLGTESFQIEDCLVELLAL